jgi:hypothetical protein
LTKNANKNLIKLLVEEVLLESFMANSIKTWAREKGLLYMLIAHAE